MKNKVDSAVTCRVCDLRVLAAVRTAQLAVHVRVEEHVRAVVDIVHAVEVFAVERVPVAQVAERCLRCGKAFL